MGTTVQCFLVSFLLYFIFDSTVYDYSSSRTMSFQNKRKHQHIWDVHPTGKHGYEKGGANQENGQPSNTPS